jgi:hypothetical protein
LFWALGVGFGIGGVGYYWLWFERSCLGLGVSCFGVGVLSDFLGLWFLLAFGMAGLCLGLGLGLGCWVNFL